MFNQFIVVGRVYKEYEIRSTKNGKSVIDLPLAVNNGKDDTTFINIQLFGSIADNTNKYVRKGDLVGIKGSIKNNNWEDKEGKKHYDYQFIADKVTFLSTKKVDENEEEVDMPKNTKSEYDTINSDVKIEDKDLPF